MYYMLLYAIMLLYAFSPPGYFNLKIGPAISYFPHNFANYHEMHFRVRVPRKKCVFGMRFDNVLHALVVSETVVKCLFLALY